MKAPTKAEQIVHAITQAYSVHEIPAKSSKYREFEIHPGGKKYFVGRNGALRTGRNISSSISLERLIPKLLQKHPHPNLPAEPAPPLVEKMTQEECDPSNPQVEPFDTEDYSMSTREAEDYTKEE